MDVTNLDAPITKRDLRDVLDDISSMFRLLDKETKRYIDGLTQETAALRAEVEKIAKQK